jgi:hypothetical protein
MHSYIRYNIVLSLQLAGLVAACTDAPTESTREGGPSARGAAVSDASKTLRGKVARLAPNVYTYSGFAADSLLETSARMANAEGDPRPLAELHRLRERLRPPSDSPATVRPAGISRIVAVDEQPTAPSVVISPENTTPAVIYDATVTNTIRGSTGTVLGAMHYFGTAGGITLTRSLASVNPAFVRPEETDREDMMGDNAFDCIFGLSFCSWSRTTDQRSSRIVEFRDLLPCGMTLKARGTFVAYWGLPEGNSISARGGVGGISLGSWGHSGERGVGGEDARSEFTCTAPAVGMDVHDADGHGAPAGGTVNTSTPKGSTTPIILDGRQSTPGNSSMADYTWKANGMVLSSGLSSPTIVHYAPIGTTTYSLTVANKAGLTSTGIVKVEVTEKAASTPPDDGSTGGGGAGDGGNNTPSPTTGDPPPTGTGGDTWYCWEVYRPESWWDYNTDTGGTTYYFDHIECGFATDRITAGDDALALNAIGSGNRPVSAVVAASERVMIVAVDSLPNGQSFASVRRARTDEADLIVVNASKLTVGDLDFGMRLARAVRAKFKAGTADLVFAPKGNTPVLADASRVAVARGLVVMLQHAPPVDVPGFGRRRAIAIDLATRSVVP